ncbi:MAG: DUF2231 domain-containing protein [Oligoflexia bacterium]|nr:DUF2231 domain-containing protein [Oligoflexia bacterium]
MINPHPPLAAFPFALVLSTLLLESYCIWKRNYAGWKPTLKLLLRGAAVFTLLSFLSGYYANQVADGTFQVPDQPIALHHLIGKLALFCVPACAVIQRFALDGEKPAAVLTYRILLLLAAALVTFTGYLGGELVFTYGAAVVAG